MDNYQVWSPLFYEHVPLVANTLWLCTYVNIDSRKQYHPDDSDASTLWPPEATVCYITDELIQAICGGEDAAAVTALDLHLRDGSLGKIRKIENLSAYVNLRLLNLSYNAIIKIENLESLRRLTELNLAENDIRSVRLHQWMLDIE